VSVRRGEGPRAHAGHCAGCKAVELESNDVVREVVEVEIVLKCRKVTYPQNRINVVFERLTLSYPVRMRERCDQSQVP
jgi:hypothetical protein